MPQPTRPPSTVARIVPVLALLAAGDAAQAQQPLQTWRPAVPASSIAAENGPGALWVNPANLAYDPDARAGLYFDREAGPGSPDSIALTGGIRGFGVGVQNLITYADGDPRLNWALDYATSAALPARINIGALFRWNMVALDQNFAAWDLGVSWRPTPWLGFGGVAQNIGSPDPQGRARPLTGGGVALRPFGRALVLGVDYQRIFSPALPPFHRDQVHGTLRLRPVEGLYIRGELLAGAPQGTTLAVAGGGLGIELYLGGVGGGAHHRSGPDGTAALQSLWLGTDEPGESVLRPARQVPRLTLDEVPPYEPRITLLSLETQPSWLQILERIRQVEEDPGARGLVLRIRDPGLSWPRWRELRQRIVALEDAGKPVVVHLLDSSRSGAFYAASAASQVLVHPAGTLELIGVSSTLTNARGTLELLGVQPQFVRRDEYKSAPETFTHTEPSEASLEQAHALLDDLYGELVAAVAVGRGLDPDQVRQIIDNGPLTAREAEAAGLIDGFAYADEIEARLAELHEGRVQVTPLLDQPVARSPWDRPDRIAVIYVDGPIVPGESSGGGLFGPRTSGSDTLVAYLRRAARDPRVRAVVLRVDSPGGSAYASDEIWRAVHLVRERGKPVVVSMGGVAASGGYYVSAGADAIWAQPNTITGSIGVYSGKFVVQELLEDVGVNTTTLQRGRNADIRSATRPWDPVQQARMHALIDEVYAQFVLRVAQGRDLTPEEVDAVARGRVWSGEAAQQVGLVDHLGGLQDAIDDARERSGIPRDREVELWSPRGPTLALGPVGPALMAAPLRALLADELAAVQRLGSLLDPLGATMVMSQYPSERAWLLVPELVQTPTP